MKISFRHRIKVSRKSQGVNIGTSRIDKKKTKMIIIDITKLITRNVLDCNQSNEYSAHIIRRYRKLQPEPLDLPTQTSNQIMDWT